MDKNILKNLYTRELLISFFDSVDDADIEKQRNGEGWKVVDNYLKAINNI